MNDRSIIEMAADLREQARRARATVDDLRVAEKDWTTHSLLIADVEEVAANALRAACQAMARVEQLAREALAKRDTR